MVREFTLEHRKKLSLAKKGIKKTSEQLKAIREGVFKLGKTSNSQGIIWSKESKEKLSKSKIKQYSNKENHPRWKGGVSRDKHSLTTPEYKKWRKSVFERDNYTCQNCRLRGINLEAHHLKSWAKYPKLRYILNNGMTFFT